MAFCITWMLLTLGVANNRVGNLTIYVDNASAKKTLSLSESSTLSNPTGELRGPTLLNAWDESVDNIPQYSDLLDGDNSVNEGYPEDENVSTRNYLAYTFYLFNSGSEDLDYTMSFNIVSEDKNISSTIRVRIYEDSELVTYAKAKSDGSNEYNTVAFESDTVINSREYSNFKVGQSRKYSIVIWIETDDADTTNEKIGGSLVLEMKFNVIR